MRKQLSRKFGALTLWASMSAGGGAAYGQEVPGILQPADQADAVEGSTRNAEASALVYSVNRIPEQVFGTARAVQVITADDIWRRGARTLPEALMEEAGIFVQQTNYGGGAPIIRGLIGKNILILLNGVKVNTATYRFGPIQYLATIDLSMVDRIEVVRGVASVLGGDALGGIINIITVKGPPLSGKSFGARVSSRFATADQGFTGRAETFGQGEKYRFLAGATHRNFDDVEGGQSTARQKATGYGERAGNISFDFFPSPDRTVSLGYADLRQSDVPRTDRVADGTNLVFNFEPQRLQLLTAGFQDLTDRKWADSLQVTGFWNRQEEGSQEIRTRTPTRQTDLNDRQDVLGVGVEVGLFPWDSHRLVYGLDYSRQKIRSSGQNVDLVTRSVTPRRGNWTDGATYESLGVYIQDRIKIRDRVTLTVGGRYGRFASAGAEDSSVGRLDLRSIQADLTGALSAVVHLTPRLNLVGSLSRGFRAPNLDDISVFSDRGAEGIEIPNPGTKPERILTLEGGVKFASPSLEGSTFYYNSNLTDLLIRAGGTVDGLPFFDLNRNGTRQAGESLVLQRKNTGEAQIHGLEAAGRWLPHPRISVFGNYTRTAGDDRTAGVPLARIPPGFGTAGLRWSGVSRARGWAELVYAFAAAQRRLNPSDVADTRIGPKGTDGFNVFHIRGGATLGRLRLRAAIENLTDQRYKYHASGVFRPGRQLVLGADFRF